MLMEGTGRSLPPPPQRQTKGQTKVQTKGQTTTEDKRASPSDSSFETSPARIFAPRFLRAISKSDPGYSGSGGLELVPLSFDPGVAASFQFYLDMVEANRMLGFSLQSLDGRYVSVEWYNAH
jgi:hypothetical protein